MFITNFFKADFFSKTTPLVYLLKMNLFEGEHPKNFVLPKKLQKKFNFSKPLVLKKI